MHRTQKVENVSCRWSVLCTLELEAKLISAASLSVSGTQLFLFQRAEISCAVAPPLSSYNMGRVTDCVCVCVCVCVCRSTSSVG